MATEEPGEDVRMPVLPHGARRPGAPVLDSPAVKADLLRRLDRIEGQVRGVRRMIEDDRYCVDVLTQLSAVKAALNKVALSLLDRHTRGCVTAALQHPGPEADRTVEELVEAIDRFVRS